MQAFAHPLRPLEDVRSLTPGDALAALAGRPAIGSGTRCLADLDPAFPIADALPVAARALLLPPELRCLAPAPLYGRAPDAKLPAGAPR